LTAGLNAAKMAECLWQRPMLVSVVEWKDGSHLAASEVRGYGLGGTVIREAE